jgi:gas vesicle protein
MRGGAGSIAVNTNKRLPNEWRTWMKGNFLAGMLVGALVGAAVGIIFAPDAGEDTRERVVEGAKKLGTGVAEKARTVVRRGEKKEEGMEEGE